FERRIQCAWIEDVSWIGSFAKATLPRALRSVLQQRHVGEHTRVQWKSQSAMDLAPMGAAGGWGGGNAVIEAAESTEAAEAAATFTFTFAFAAASPTTTTTWLPTHQAFGPWSKGTWQSKLTLSEKSVFCRVLLKNVFSSECSLA
ncbi:MAG: hypothetical protein ACKVPZ_12825, partial [Burkholderiaceae bacterium]